MLRTNGDNECKQRAKHFTSCHILGILSCGCGSPSCLQRGHRKLVVLFASAGVSLPSCRPSTEPSSFLPLVEFQLNVANFFFFSLKHFFTASVYQISPHPPPHLLPAPSTSSAPSRDCCIMHEPLARSLALLPPTVSAD